MGVIGGASRKLIENVASPVSLSPDGTRLAFIRGSPTQTALVVANVDGTGEREVAVRKLTNGAYSTGGPSWSPDQIFCFDFSRDGHQLALSRGTQTSDVILIKDSARAR